jgi:hypothetical protein
MVLFALQKFEIRTALAIHSIRYGVEKVPGFEFAAWRLGSEKFLVAASSDQYPGEKSCPRRGDMVPGELAAPQSDNGKCHRRHERPATRTF